uniref:Calponin n=1 Tax=Coturnix japonica TaxID=93934 RepID=A0A8C2TG84_COTJA
MRCCARAAALHLGGGGRIPGIAAVTEESAAAQRARRGGMNAAGSVPGPVGGGGKQPQQQLVLFPFDSCRVSGSLRVRLWAVLDDSAVQGWGQLLRAEQQPVVQDVLGGFVLHHHPPSSMPTPWGPAAALVLLPPLGSLCTVESGFPVHQEIATDCSPNCSSHCGVQWDRPSEVPTGPGGAHRAVSDHPISPPHTQLAQKYDPQKEAELRTWIESVTGRQIGADFQKGLKDGVILCELMNKLQPNSVRKINRSALNWHQLENLSNFIKAMASYGMNPVDLFEANDLFESGNLTQVQVSLLALAGMAKTKGLQSGVDIGVKYSERQQRNFDEAKMKAGQCVIGLQMGTNKCASQSGMTAYGTRRHLYDPKNQILPPMDHSTISLQMGTNKCASQVGMTAPGTRRHIYDAKMGLEKCDNSSMSLQMGSNQGANQSGQVFGLGRQIYDPKYCPQGTPGDTANNANEPGTDPIGYHYYQQEESC